MFFVWYFFVWDSGSVVHNLENGCIMNTKFDMHVLYNNRDGKLAE